jgi:hypothetical protein
MQEDAGSHAAEHWTGRDHCSTCSIAPSTERSSSSCERGHHQPRVHGQTPAGLPPSPPNCAVLPADPKLACDCSGPRGVEGEGENTLPSHTPTQGRNVGMEARPKAKHEEEEKKKQRMRPGCHVPDSPHLVFPTRRRPTAVKPIEPDESGRRLPQKSNER